MPYTVSTLIDIPRPKQVVWNTLIDGPGWAAWSTLLRWRAGTFVVGQRVALTIDMPEARYNFDPTILQADGTTLAWVGRTFGLPGVLDGHHRFVLTAINATTTRVQNAETWSGLMLPLVRNTSMMRAVEPAFAQMNQQFLRHLSEAP
jgi:hypothetical protein